MWNIKKESRVTVASEFIHEDHVLFVGFGHEFDDATDEPKSVTSGQESQHRRHWHSAGNNGVAQHWSRLMRTRMSGGVGAGCLIGRYTTAEWSR
jgi:hypothetical protein